MQDLDFYTKDDDIIGINLYGGKSIFGGRETPEEADIIHCDHASECSFYKSGRCLKCRNFAGNTCVYGAVERAHGYTSRAAKYYKWHNHFHSHPAYAKVHSLDKNTCFGIVGDYYCFSTTFVGPKGFIICNEEHPLCDEAWVTKHTFFIKKENTTPEFLHKLFLVKPQALMGGIIKEYQSNIVPAIKAEIKMKAPDLFAEFAKEYPEETGVTFVGKKAYINSLKGGCTIKADGGVFTLSDDKTKLICEKYHSAFAPFKAKNMRLEIIVEPEMTTVIENDDQVEETTVLAG